MVNKEWVKCGACEKEFLAYLFALKRGQGKFCSLKCANKKRNKDKIKPKNLICSRWLVKESIKRHIRRRALGGGTTT